MNPAGATAHGDRPERHPEPVDGAPSGRSWDDVVALVTGANTGIGRSTAARLAELGATVLLGCRSVEKARTTLKAMVAETGNSRLEVLSLDLADLGAVRASAREVLTADRPLHLLVNNAGVAFQRGQTADGFELAFGTNHLGHFLLTQLLLPRLLESGPARVINVTSGNHARASAIDFSQVQNPTRTFVGLREYNVSKLCNVLFTQELARRCEPEVLSAFSANPGTVASEIWRRMPRPTYLMYRAMRRMKSNDQGALPALRAATELGLEAQSGAYLDEDTRIVPASTYATPRLAAELWSRSLAWVGHDSTH